MSREHTQNKKQERELSLEIASFLGETTKQQHQDNFKRYKREISKYYHVEWAVAEEINKSFIPKPKHRLHWRAATEILEQLLTIKSGGLSAEETNQLLDEALESAKRLAIHAWVQDYSQVLNTWKQRSQKASEKPLVKGLLQGTTKLTIGNEYLKQQSPVTQLEEVEEDVDPMDEVEQKIILGEGDVGPQPSTTTVTPTIITIQHQQTIQHRELPVSNGTQITTLTTTISINATDSTTINTIEPYYNVNNELHHPLRWHCTGQSPTTFSPLLENNNQSSLAPISNSKWLQDPIFQETDPMEESKEGEDRISGFCIQQQANADICTTIEDYQSDEEDLTVTYLSEENVQMDRRLTREDDFHDSSSGRSSITYKIPTTGSVEDITPDETELGSNLQINGLPIQRIQAENPKTIIHVDASNSEWGISSGLITASGFWNQEEKTHSVNARELKTILFAIQHHAGKCENSTIKIYSDNKTALKYTTKSGGTISMTLQDLAIQIQELCNQHNIKPTEEAAIRINDPEKHVQLYTEKMGEAEDRRLCSAPQPPAANVLDIVNRPSSFSRRFPATSMVTEGDVFISTLETDTPSTEKTSRTKGKASSSSDSIVAQPILVPDDPKDETPTTTNHLENKSEMVSSRLAIINNSRLQDGLDEETDNKEYSSIHLNTLRSSIASVFSITHSQKQPIAGQPLIKDFFTAKRNFEVKIPCEQQLATWDVNIFVEYIKKELSPTSGLSLVQLQLKTILLLCIATM
ncbi:hypothetical protein G6F43_007863 [Rhizopus delemar]|nr:hypothetical protein G6F43_007863 [Rhizopus delemar]